MNKETKLFWNWLQRSCESKVVVRACLQIIEKENKKEVLCVQFHIFYKTRFMPLSHLFLEFPHGVGVLHMSTFEELTPDKLQVMLDRWYRERFEDWIKHEQLIALYTERTFTTPCKIGYLMREELAKLSGFLLGLAKTSPFPHANILFERIEGLRSSLTKQTQSQLEGMQQFITTFQDQY